MQYHKIIIAGFIIMANSLLMSSCNTGKKEGNATNNNSSDSLKKSNLFTDKKWKNLNIARIDAHLFVPVQHDERYSQLGFKNINSIAENGILNPNIIKSFSKQLDTESIDRILSIISTYDTTFNLETADCYWPHHGLVMYDSNDSIVAHMSICFDCNNYSLFPFHHWHIELSNLKPFFEKLEFPIHKDQKKYFELRNKLGTLD